MKAKQQRAAGRRAKWRFGRLNELFLLCLVKNTQQGGVALPTYDISQPHQRERDKDRDRDREFRAIQAKTITNYSN